ncbi:MAG: hydrolase 1, exosortase A system-associated [Chromatiales bacterium]|nr:hydrolase 1, exosortase A system-associated [Chromatiales bacterium]
MLSTDRFDHDGIAGALAMTFMERPILFDCQGDRLVGILAVPHSLKAATGVLILVGGPQYRSGSHRQFTFLARALATRGIVSLRFDARGMGDSEGGLRSFTALDDDIRAAIDTLLREVPKLTGVAIWGLCDAASAAMMYACEDARVSRLVLLNPWVHTEALAARARLTHYYGRRLLHLAVWRKLIFGRMDWSTTIKDFGRSLSSIFSSRDSEHTPSARSTSLRQANQGNFIDKMRLSFERFQGRTCIILSGQDLTAKEFLHSFVNNKRWRQAFRKRNVQRIVIPEANHTFSSQKWRIQVERETIEAIEAIGSNGS